MRKRTGMLAALAVATGLALGIPPLARPAGAGPLPVVVKSVDAKDRMLVTEDGKRFHAASDVGISGLEPGTRLLLYTRTINGRKTITSYAFARS